MHRAASVLAFVSLMLLATTLPAAEPPPPPPVDEAALKKGLMSVLGDAFEFVGGELAKGGDAPSWKPPSHPYWFAKVRPLRKGAFSFQYRVDMKTSQGANINETLRVAFVVGDADRPARSISWGTSPGSARVPTWATRS